jgi:hypothetical protein
LCQRVKVRFVEQMRSEGNADRPFAVNEAVGAHGIAQLLEYFGRQRFIRRE